MTPHPDLDAGEALPVLDRQALAASAGPPLVIGGVGVPALRGREVKSALFQPPE